MVPGRRAPPPSQEYSDAYGRFSPAPRRSDSFPPPLCARLLDVYPDACAAYPLPPPIGGRRKKKAKKKRSLPPEIQGGGEGGSISPRSREGFPQGRVVTTTYQNQPLRHAMVSFVVGDGRKKAERALFWGCVRDESLPFYALKSKGKILSDFPLEGSERTLARRSKVAQGLPSPPPFPGQTNWTPVGWRRRTSFASFLLFLATRYRRTIGHF